MLVNLSNPIYQGKITRTEYERVMASDANWWQDRQGLSGWTPIASRNVLPDFKYGHVIGKTKLTACVLRGR